MSQSRKHWRVLLAVLAASRSLIAACGGDDDRLEPTAAARTTAGGGTDFSSLSGTINGSGSSFQKPSTRPRSPASPSEPRTSPSTTARRLGQGQAGPRRRASSTGPAPTASPKPDDLSKYAARAARPLLPDRRGADHGLVQPARRQEAPTRARARSAKIFARKIKKWNDAGDRRRTTPASTSRAPPSRSRTGPTLRARRPTSRSTSRPRRPTDWTLGSGDTVDWAAGTPGRQRNPGVAQIVEATPKARSATSTSPTRPRPSLQHARDQERGRASSSAPTLDGAAAAVANADVSRRPVVRPDQRLGRRRLPDHLAHLDHRVQEADAPDTGKTLKGWINYVLYRRSGARERRGLRAAARVAWRTRPSPSSTSSDPASSRDAWRPHRSGARPSGGERDARPRRRRVDRPLFRVVGPRRRPLGSRDPRADRVFHDQAGVARVPPRGLRVRHGATSGIPNDDKFGALRVHLRHARITSSIALVIAVPLSIGIALFTNELAPRRLRRPTIYLIDLLAAIPSVVYGLWALAVLATPHQPRVPGSRRHDRQGPGARPRLRRAGERRRAS